MSKEKEYLFKQFKFDGLNEEQSKFVEDISHIAPQIKDSQNLMQYINYILFRDDEKKQWERKSTMI